MNICFWLVELVFLVAAAMGYVCRGCDRRHEYCVSTLHVYVRVLSLGPFLFPRYVETVSQRMTAVPLLYGRSYEVFVVKFVVRETPPCFCFFFIHIYIYIYIMLSN